MEILPLLRFAMAVCVVGTHMWRAAFADAGLHAVFGFFAISGYLITRISVTSYKNRPVSFLFNRFLRIYPQYLAAVALAALIIWRLPTLAAHFNNYQRLPLNPLEFIQQTSIFGLRSSPFLMLPASWSLNVELYFYLLIGLLTHRSELLTYAATIVTAVMGYQAATGHAHFGFYGDPLGNAFVFFLGSSAFFLSRRLHPPHWLGWAMLALYIALAILSHLFVTGSKGAAALLALSALAVTIMLIRLPQIRPIHPKAMNFAGRLAYPLFLVHWACCTPLFGLLAEQSGPAMFLGGMALSLCVASLMVFGIDYPIEKLRRQVRSAGTHHAKPDRLPEGLPQLKT